MITSLTNHETKINNKQKKRKPTWSVCGTEAMFYTSSFPVSQVVNQTICKNAPEEEVHHCTHRNIRPSVVKCTRRHTTHAECIFTLCALALHFARCFRISRNTCIGIHTSISIMCTSQKKNTRNTARQEFGFGATSRPSAWRRHVVASRTFVHSSGNQPTCAPRCGGICESCAHDVTRRARRIRTTIDE